VLRDSYFEFNLCFEFLCGTQHGILILGAASRLDAFSDYPLEV